MKKLLHERLREEAEEYGLTKVTYSPDGIHKLADEIERYYIPRPRFEDGEPVTVENRYEIDWEDGGEWLMTATSKDGIPMATFVSREPSKAKMTPDGFVVRKHPKVLDADGVEIKVGDTVWCIDTGTKLKVISQDCEDGTLLCSNDFIYDPDVLTHKEPDSLKKLYYDMMEHHENWESDPNEWLEMADRLFALIEKVG